LGDGKFQWLEVVVSRNSRKEAQKAQKYFALLAPF
jgi:hypothetical protein